VEEVAAMRGEERRQRSMLLVVNLEERIPKEHPLKRVKQMADAALKELSPLFDQMYSVLGRPSIPPERLLKASLKNSYVFCSARPNQNWINSF
jgi:hypothetical protein